MAANFPMSTGMNAGGTHPQQMQVSSAYPLLPARMAQPLERGERPDAFIKESFKQDITKSRELLTDLLNKSTLILQENIKQPGNQKESHRLRLEKSLEELFTVLDQIETNLKLAIQWHSQAYDSKKSFALPIATNKTEDIPGKTVPFPAYLKVIKFQIQAAKDLHDYLTDAENKLQMSLPAVPSVSMSSSILHMNQSNVVTVPTMPSAISKSSALQL